MQTPEILLLDTHVWIWLMERHDRLAGSEGLEHLQKASAANALRVAAISVWELGTLEAKGRISMQIPCLDWVQQALVAPGVSLAQLSPEIAIESSRLPGEFHGDPADRILVATARKLGARLVSADKKILEYGHGGHVHVLGV